MKKIFISIVLLVASLIFSVNDQRLYAEMLSNVERIRSFDSHVMLHKDDSLTIKETIVYTTGGASHHGIYRDIPLSAIELPAVKNQSIRVLSVTDGDGSRIKFTTEVIRFGEAKIFRIKIGDPNVTFSGDKTYVVTYIFKHALSRKESSVYLYWNMTGNTWQFPIEKVSINISKDADGPSYSISSMSCTFGYFGSTDSCNSKLHQDSSIISAEFDQVFNPRDGVTVLIPLTYNLSPFPNDQQIFFEVYGALIVFLLAVIMTLTACRIIWKKYGKDPDDERAVMAEYEPPAGVTPFEASYLLDEKITPKSIGATLLYEAQRGVIQIKGYENDRFLGSFQKLLFKKLLFKLILVRESDNEASKELLKAVFRITDGLPAFGTILFGSKEEKDVEGRPVIELKNVQLQKTDFSQISNAVENDLKTKKYFEKIVGVNRDNLPVISPTGLFLFFIFPLILMAAVYFLQADNSMQHYLVAYTIILWICLGITYKSLTKKTLLGVDIKYKLLGLKLYIDVAEEERIAFHNAPAKTPNLYLTLLPWAVLFGLEKKWSKEFEGMTFNSNEPQMSFYIGVGSGVAISGFGSSMEQFSSVAVSSGTLSSSSGGSSGGGGGGGGGGSW